MSVSLAQPMIARDGSGSGQEPSAKTSQHQRTAYTKCNNTRASLQWHSWPISTTSCYQRFRKHSNVHTPSAQPLSSIQNDIMFPLSLDI